MAKFKWADEYKKRGFEVFSPETIKSLRAIQRKYRFDYRTFFMTVEEAFEGSSFTKERKRVNDILKKIDEIYSLVDDLLKVSQPLDEAGLEKLFNLTNEVDEDFRFFSNPENITVATQKRIQEAEKKSGIKSSDITQTNKLIKAKILRAGAERKRSDKPSIFAPVTKPIGETVKETLYKMTGPFEGVLRAAEKGVGGIGSVIKEAKQRKIEAQQFALDRATLLSEEATPEFLGAYRQLGIEGLGGLSKRAQSGLRKRVEGARQPISSMNYMPSTSLSSKSRMDKRSQDALGQALFTFFHKDAFRAKWTREVFEKISGKSASGVDKESGSFAIFGNLKEQLASLTPVLIGLGSAAAVAAGFFASWKLGNWLQENVPGFKKYGTKAVDVMGETMAAPAKAGFGIRNWWATRQQRKDMTPLMRKALSYQDKGMNYKESMEKAAKDLGVEVPQMNKRVSSEQIGAGVSSSSNVQINNANQISTPSVPIIPQSSAGTDNEDLKKTLSDNNDKLIEAIKSPKRAPAFESSGKDTDSIRNPIFSEMQ